MASVKQIEAFFDNYKFDKNVLTLNCCAEITDLRKFVFSHIRYLKANSDNKLFKPYASRLKEVYLKLNNEKTNNTNNIPRTKKTI